MPSQKIIPKDKNFSRINLEKKRFSEKIAFRPRNPTLSNVHERTVIEIDLFENSIVHLYELISPDRRPTPSQSHKSFARHRYKKRKRGKFVGKELDRQKETAPRQTERDIHGERYIDTFTDKQRYIDRKGDTHRDEEGDLEGKERYRHIERDREIRRQRRLPETLNPK